MIFLKRVLLILGIFLYTLLALLINIIFFPFSPFRLRLLSGWTKAFCGYLRFILNVKVHIEGDIASLRGKGNFIISNHVGYLDGIILGSLFPLVYVSKSDVKKWPIFGLMTISGGTIFVDRKSKEKSPDYVRQTSEALTKKINVLIFPEGTSTNGERVRPFQPVHFQAPLEAKSPIQPVSITYLSINGENVGVNNRDKVCWYGQMKFNEHIAIVLKLKKIVAKVVIHPKIEPAAFSQYDNSRKNLSEALHNFYSEKYPLFK
jgi:1-acyl-sn-glycerol-3-phosphate acyltransferase